MERIIVLILVGLLFTGCSTLPSRIRVETVTVKVPVLYCPLPPVDATTRPGLPISEIQHGDEVDPGKVVQRYKATVKTLQNYSLRLEKVIKQYEKYNEAYKNTSLNQNKPKEK